MFHIGSWQRRWLANEADATANGLADIPGWSAKIQEDCDAVRAGLRKEIVEALADIDMDGISLACEDMKRKSYSDELKVVYEAARIATQKVKP